MIYTFYSFKGGVGRSMALAGIAYLMAERGLRVLAIDFDLEAPGLERYFFETDEARRVRERLGLIDLIQTYKRALTNEAEFQRAAFRQWRSFVTDAIPRTGRGGSVDLMTAGCREPEEKLSTYALSVRTFDWQDFFHNWNGEKFFDWLRRQFGDPMSGYDVVLVDSRTGVTEMGGVCTYQLADVAVMLCAANYQSLEGTIAVARDFRSDVVLALRRGRPLDILVIPARMEDSHPDRDRFLAELERGLQSDGLPKILADAGLDYRKLALPYNPQYAVAERLVGEATGLSDRVASSPDVVEAFGRLADALTLLAVNGRLAAQQVDALARLRGQSSADVTLSVADPTRHGAGFDVFLDSHRDDDEVVDRIRRELEAAGLLYVRPDPVLTGAHSADQVKGFLDALGRNLEYSEYLLVVFGRGNQSPYREAMVRKARERGKPVIVPVVIGDSASTAALASYGLDDFRAFHLGPADHVEFASRVRALVERLRSTTRPGRAAAEVTDPYPGARPFGEDDAPYFFGRLAEAKLLFDNAHQRDVVVLTGASGVGKTSLLRSGFIPMMRTDRDAPWAIELLDLSAEDGERALDAVLQRTEESDSRRSLVVLDGVDSFPGAGDEATRGRRFDRVRAIVARASPAYRLVLSVRGSWTEGERATVLGPMAAERRTTQDLTPLSSAALRQAIERPATDQRHLFEAGLVDRLLSDAGPGASAIALIQLVLPLVWQDRRRGWLTNHAYDGTGGIRGLLRTRRDALLQRLPTEDQRRVTLFLSSLVSLDNALRLVPEQRSWRELASIPALGPDTVALRDQLARERFIVVTRGVASIFATSSWSMYDVECALAASDASSYLSPSEIPAPDFLLWRRRFSSFVYDWRTQGRAPETLVTGPALDEAERWLASHGAEMTAGERELIQASADAQTRRLRDEEELRAEARMAEERRGQTEQLARAETARAREAERAQAAAEQAHTAEQRRAEAAERSSIAEVRRRKTLTIALMGASVLLLLVIGLAWTVRKEYVRAEQAGRELVQFVRRVQDAEAKAQVAEGAAIARDLELKAAAATGAERERLLRDAQAEAVRSNELKMKAAKVDALQSTSEAALRQIQELQAALALARGAEKRRRDERELSAALERLRASEAKAQRQSAELRADLDKLRASLVSIPQTVGMRQAEAVAALKRALLLVGRIDFQSSRAADRGNVIAQEPAAGSLSTRGSAVNLLVGGDRTR